MYECLKELHVPTIVCEQGHIAEHKRNLIGEMSAFWCVKEKEGACEHSFDAVRLHQKNVHMPPPFISLCSPRPSSVQLFSLEATCEPDDWPDLTENLCLIKYTSIPQHYNSTLSKEYALNLAVGNGNPKDMTTIQDTFLLPTNVMDSILNFWPN